MNGINFAVIGGTVGQKPESKTVNTQKGDMKVVKFSLATNEKRGDKQETTWHNIEAWGNLAEVCEKYLDKGKNVLVRGKIKNEAYEKDGVKKFFTKIVIDFLDFLPGGSKDSSKEEESSSEPVTTSVASRTKQAEKNVNNYTSAPSSPVFESDDDLPF